MDELLPLTNRWWDWEAERWDVTGLRLIADNDLARAATRPDAR
jgi:hypothetical protein